MRNCTGRSMINRSGEVCQRVLKTGRQYGVSRKNDECGSSKRKGVGKGMRKRRMLIVNVLVITNGRAGESEEAKANTNANANGGRDGSDE